MIKLITSIVLLITPTLLFGAESFDVSQTPDVEIRGEITPETAKNFKLPDKKLILIHIDSEGGYSKAANNIIGKIKEAKRKGKYIYCTAGATIFSAAENIFSECNVRVLATNTAYGNHFPWFINFGPVDYNLVNLFKTRMESDLKEFSERTRIPLDLAKKIYLRESPFPAETWLNISTHMFEYVTDWKTICRIDKKKSGIQSINECPILSVYNTIDFNK